MRIMRNNVAAIVTGILAFGSFSATRIMGADWPCFRGPNHDGISTEAIVWPKSGPRQVWKINVGIGHSALAVVGDRAYTMGNANETDTVFSIDVATGRITQALAQHSVSLRGANVRNAHYLRRCFSQSPPQSGWLDEWGRLKDGMRRLVSWSGMQ